MRSGHLLVVVSLLFSNAFRHTTAGFSMKPHSFSRNEHQIIFKQDGRNSNSCPLSPVALPTQNATKSFWLASPDDNPLAEEGSKGDLTERADVCIIGSGITGVSAAWHLSQMLRDYEDNTSVVILEAREFCSGATGRNGGHLSPAPFLSFVDRQARYNSSEEAGKSYILERHAHDSVVNFLKERRLESKVDLVEGGRIDLLTTEDEQRAAKLDFAAASKAGLNLSDVRWISNRELTKEYGLNPSLNYTGVWWPAHNLWPYKLVTELFKDAQAAGRNVTVTLHTKTPVTSITRQHEQPYSRNSTNDRRAGLWALQTPRGIINCDYVLHATNGYAGHLLPFFAGGGLESGDQDSPHGKDFGIIPTRGQVAAIRASVPASHLHWRNSWVSNGGWEYWFPRFQGVRDMGSDRPLIILGGGRQSSGGTLESGETDDGVVNTRVTKALKAFLPRYFPDLFKESEIENNWEMEWTGIMGYTKTYDPYVGPVLHPSWSTAKTQQNPFDQQYIAAGYTGHGMVRAPACAEAVAGMIKARIIGEKWLPPDWLPERYLTWAAR